MNCENARPPTTAIPSGRRDSEPTPTPSAIGSVPISAAMVVIMIGRKRMLHACRIASRADLPSTRCARSEEHTSELQSQSNLVCRLLLEKKKKNNYLANSTASSTTETY